jgi:hypothetical protein
VQGYDFESYNIDEDIMVSGIPAEGQIMQHQFVVDPGFDSNRNQIPGYAKNTKESQLYQDKREILAKRILECLDP